MYYIIVSNIICPARIRRNIVQTVVEGSGLSYVGYGFLITVIPLLIIGMIARFYCKVNYFTLMGLIAGSNTDPPALAYANQASGNDAPAVGYSTVLGVEKTIDFVEEFVKLKIK